MGLIREIAGRSLIGFWGLFPGDYGDPASYFPYATVTPSSINGALLPFRCPYCGNVRTEFADAKKREKWHDRRQRELRTADRKRVRVYRNNYWCPSCRGRFYLNTDGMPLSSPLPANAAVAPSKVERKTVSPEGYVSTTVAMQDERPMNGLDVLGCIVLRRAA